MNMLLNVIRRNKSERKWALKRAIVSAFNKPPHEVRIMLGGFDEDDWRSILWWLDVSGMALYFLDLARTAAADSLIPRFVMAELENREGRNRARSAALIKEAGLISSWFNAAGMTYALLKGITLAPDSVPDPALRTQTDLDFLVPRNSLRAARHFIGRLGYSLHVDNGNVLEFKAGTAGRPDILMIYSEGTQRSLDFRVAEDDSELLERRQFRDIAGSRIATLSSADVLVQQATHLLKHLCGEFTRLSWVLEFRRHVETRQDDTQFWNDVADVAATTQSGDLSLSVAMWLSQEFFGWLQAGAARRWGPNRLPAAVRLWLERYAGRQLLSDAIRTKYYVLLRKQVAGMVGDCRSTRRILLPSTLPFRVMDRPPNESMRHRMARYAIEAKYLLLRLRFHVVEGAHLAIESARWRKAVARLDCNPAEKSGVRRVIRRAGFLLLLLCATFAVGARGVYAQSVPTTAPSTLPTTQSSPVEDVGTTSALEDKVGVAVMPAANLIEVLQNDPAVMVETKSIVADFLQQQGRSTAPDAITDEQVYNAIESSAELRGIVTRSLVSRGYLTEEQVREAATRARNSLQDSSAQTEGPGDGNGDPLTRVPSMSVGLKQTTGYPAHKGTERRDATETRNSNAPRNVTDSPEVLRRPAPYNLLSLRDLYTQVPDSPDKLKRFGSDVFVAHGTRRAEGLADYGAGGSDIPAGPDYVLGPGDQLSVTVWGGVSQNLLRVVNREGGIALPEAGLVQVAGLTMERAQSVIENALRQQYRNAQVAVTVAHIRTIRIFVVGDVQRPGSYEISSVASAVSALFAAGGPTAVGSLRLLRHYRNEKMIGEIDLYDFMLHGVRAGNEGLQSGDTLLVPPAGPQVAVFGEVKRPAIYELRNEKSIADVLDDAGGMTAAAAPGQITVDRVVPSAGRQVLGADPNVHEAQPLTEVKLERFEVKDGDRIHVPSVLPVNERVVYVQGHVARPGRIAFHDNMRLSDVLTTYADMLPEPADKGELIRLAAPDMHPETIEFNVADVLIGNSTLTLQPFDTVRVFGRYERDAPMVSILGEVQRPGDYPLFEGMTTAQLVRAAGGFKRDALLSTADLTSYQVMNGSRISVSRRDVPIGSVVIQDDRAADVQLKPGDVLTVHQISGWNDIGASITIQGEVGHPGSYGFQEGEHLSDVLKRAGGFRDTAYPQGAVLTRPEVAALEEKSRQELIRQIETSSAAARLSTRGATTDQTASLQLIQQQRDEVLAELKSRPAVGRLVIHIAQDVDSWAGSAADIEVRRGDVLNIPKRPGFVLVSGQVYNASAITYAPHQTARWYLEKAGGATQIADRKHIFIVRANGEVIGRHEHDVLSTRMDAGDTVVVPQKIQGPSVLLRNLLATAQVAASITIAAAVAGL